MDRCYKNLRVVFYALSLLFWVLGCAILGGGIAFHISTRADFPDVAPGYLLITPAALAVTAGCISLLVGCLGCFGAMTNNQCMTITFCTLGSVVALLEVIAGTLLISLETEIKSSLSNELLLSIREKYPISADSNKSHMLISMWNTIQYQLSCCGANSYSDWYNSHAWPGEDWVPRSCCIDSLSDCSQSANPQLFYSQGCLAPIESWIETQLLTISVIAFVAAGIGILAIITAVSMLCLRRRNRKPVKQFNF